jgi:hypothetical protein
MKNKLIEEYINWLSQDIYSLNKNNVDIFTTPFLDPINDCNQVKITYTSDNRIRISDEAYTYFMINHEFGINFRRSPQKVEQFQALMNMYLMELEDNELVRYCEEKEFAWALHYYSIGVSAIQNSFSGISFSRFNAFSIERNTELTKESELIHYVERGFINRKINYHRSVKKMGISGFNHKYDFSFGDNESVPKLLMKSPNALRPDNTQLMLFEWEDYLNTITNERPMLFIVANDKEQKIDRKIIKLIVNRENVEYCPLSEESNWMEECRKRA